MSEKKAKQNRKMQLMTDEANAKEAAENMAKSISKMYEDRDDKALTAKDRLVSQLEVTVDKYRTANGVMSVLATLRDVIGSNHTMDISEEIGTAKTIASTMAEVTQDMASKAYDLVPDDMDKLCDEFYDKEFSEHNASVIEMTTELMILQLCQNVGPNAEDIVEFLKQADQEIEKAKKDLKTFCKENDLDYLEICGVREE